MDKSISNNSPIISVVMSVYNEPQEWLHQSIYSILNQTFSDFEFIIICDNPVYKEGIELLREYAEKDSRVLIMYNEENIGLTKSLNKGLAIARGEYIARMDADDISKPERLEKQLNYFESHNDVDICGSNAKMFGSRNGIIHCPQYNEQVALYLDNCFIHSAVMMKRVVADLKYDEECKAAQDYELWFRAQQRGFVFYNIQEELVLYRVSEGQITNKNKTIQRRVASKVRRASLNTLLDSQNLSMKLSQGESVTFKFISAVFKMLELEDNKKKRLLYYLLLSTNYKKRDALYFLYRSGLISYLPFSYVTRVLINNNEVSLF